MINKQPHQNYLILGAKPPAYIYWNSDPELFQDDTHEEISREENGVTFRTVNRLTFQAKRQLTSLSCFASNKVLDEKKSIHLKRDTTINVKYKPVVQKLPRIEMLNAVHGEPISLLCKFTANPASGVKVTWYRNGLVLDRDQSTDKRTDKADGSVLRMDADKSLEGLYSCSAENELVTILSYLAWVNFINMTCVFCALIQIHILKE